jgi:hypothetical protein
MSMTISLEVGSTMLGIAALVVILERFISPKKTQEDSNCENQTRNQKNTSNPEDVMSIAQAHALMKEIKPMRRWQFAALLQIMLFSSATCIASFALGIGAPSRLEIVLCIFSVFMFISAPFVYQSRILFLHRIDRLQSRLDALN